MVLFICSVVFSFGYYYHLCISLDLQAPPVGMDTWRLDLLKENMVQTHGRVISQNDRAANLLKQQVSLDIGFIASRRDMKILELKLARMRRQKADLHRRIHEKRQVLKRL